MMCRQVISGFFLTMDYENIYEAVMKRNPEKAQALMLKHIQEIHAALDLGTNGKKTAKKANRQ